MFFFSLLRPLWADAGRQAARRIAHEDPDCFEKDLRRALLAYDPSGRYEESIHTEALIATR
ncbi:hypothetical protein ACFW9S_31890 [Streptomyces anulatus]|uniref:hypothetical protein n=1 Tax=Streptomyces anulatus TaxID=1892 RepID=UPI003676AD3D